MRKLLCLLLLSSTSLFAQEKIQLANAKFNTGDQPDWKNPTFDDRKWVSIQPTQNWELQGFPEYNGFAWYRFHFTLPQSLKTKAYWKDSLRINMAKIDDVGAIYLNGEKIGQSGSFETDPGGYSTAWNIPCELHVSSKHPALKWGQENVIAVRVYDANGGGGIFGAVPFIAMMELVDGIQMKLNLDNSNSSINLHSNMGMKISGNWLIRVYDAASKETVKLINKNITLDAMQTLVEKIKVDPSRRLSMTAVFKEIHSGKEVRLSSSLPYILTPPVSAKPKINGAKIFGARSASPIVYKIAATGKRPLHYRVVQLPSGLFLDSINGIISGAIIGNGTYKMKLVVTNDLGTDYKDFSIKIGELLALTPPMGWNSWNCWGLSVTSDKVKASAQALIDKGLIDHGWSYINIDDGWEQPKRDAANNVLSNEKFPSMRALSDWLHLKGLKFGIYSSPGPLTCGGYLGSYQYEQNDASTYASWGVDYLKYDWCSFGEIAGKDTSMDMYQRPYKIMRDALARQPRDILFSLCQYGMKKVWEWGDQVNGNCWRTTGDIEDTWESLRGIGFSQTEQYRFTKPGRWSDPDMLIVGQVGWGESLHNTRLSPDEQYTHISLWSILAAPLLIGCDISKMDDFTVSLLSNDEVIAVNQDPLGKEAKQWIKNKNYQVWMKELEDGSHAIGIFNLDETDQTISIHWSDLSLKSVQKTRDLWRQKDLGIANQVFTSRVAGHGVTLIKVTDK